MNSVRAQMIANGNLVADIRTDARVGKTAAKRAKRFKAAAEARALGTSKAVKAITSAVVKSKAKSR